GLVARMLACACGVSGIPPDFCSAAFCASKRTGGAGGAVLAATALGVTIFAGAAAGAWPPSTASCVGATEAVVITLAWLTWLADIVTASFAIGRPEAIACDEA